mgnify:CR=1 FL=1
MSTLIHLEISSYIIAEFYLEAGDPFIYGVNPTLEGHPYPNPTANLASVKKGSHIV